MFLAMLVELEKEEKEAFDEAKKERKKKKKGKKRSSSGEAVQDDEAIEEAGDDEAEDDAEVEDCNGEAFMFHKKTRVADTITPEALMLTLHYGSGNLVIKSDEFKVRFNLLFSVNRAQSICVGYLTPFSPSALYYIIVMILYI